MKDREDLEGEKIYKRGIAGDRGLRGEKRTDKERLEREKD